MGRVFFALARFLLILWVIAPEVASAQGGQGNNIVGNNQPFGNVNFANGYVIVNGTKRFGPDQGPNYFQNALNSLAQPPNQFSGGGGDIAVYGFNFVPSTLVLTNKWNGTFKIHGAGVTSSGIIGPAPVIRCTSAGGGYVDFDTQGRLVTDISDLCIAAITNAVTNLIEIHNNGATRIHDNLITTWPYITNHWVIGTSPGFFLPFSQPPNIEQDIVGISVTANLVDYQYIERNSFELLGCGIDILGYDHVRITANFFSQVGNFKDTSLSTQASANLWPANQAESIPTCIIARTPQSNGDFHSYGNYFYVSGWCYMFLNQLSVGAFGSLGQVWKNCIIQDDTIENSFGYILTDGFSRMNVIDCPVLKSSILWPLSAVNSLVSGTFGIVATNQFMITSVTNIINSGDIVKQINMHDSQPTFSQGLNVPTTQGGNALGVTIATGYETNSGISNAWISAPIVLHDGADANMNGTWVQQPYDATKNIFTWTNGSTTAFVLWARSNAGPYDLVSVPGALSSLVLSSNVAAGITNPATWACTYSFNNSFGWGQMAPTNGFSNCVQVLYNTVAATVNFPAFMNQVTWTNFVPTTPGIFGGNNQAGVFFNSNNYAANGSLGLWEPTVLYWRTNSTWFRVHPVP